MAKDLYSSSSSDSDDVFDVRKNKSKKPLSVKAKKKSVSKVATPGNYSLEVVGSKIRPVFDKNHSLVSKRKNANTKNTTNLSVCGASANYQLSGVATSRIKPFFASQKPSQTEKRKVIEDDSDTFESET